MYNPAIFVPIKLRLQGDCGNIRITVSIGGIEMNEEEFLTMLIDTVKYDPNFSENTDKLLTILTRSEIKFDPTRVYGNLPGRFKENVQLRVHIPLLGEAREQEEELDKLAAHVYEPNTEYEYDQLLIRPRKIDLKNREVKEHKAIFDRIREEVIQGIRGGNYMIWAAVAWFSDEEIYQELLLRKEAGVHIRIIVSDEKTNQNLLQKMSNEFEVKVSPLRGPKGWNRLHDKFCITDLEYVMHGSYNWTPNARNNDETLVTAADRDLVKQFADEFQKLWLELN